MKPVILYSGNTLPSPAEYEEGDLFLLVSAGELYVRNAGSWLLLGPASGYVTDGANVGGGAGEVFDQKVGTILQFRTLESPDNTIQIVTTGGTVQVQLDPGLVALIYAAVTDGANRGTGLEIFASKVGSNLEFRTINSAGGGVDLLAGQDADQVYLASLTSSDSSVNIVKNYGVEVDLTVNPAALGAVTGGANLGGGQEVFKQKNGNVLEFRTLENVGGGAPVLDGYGTDTIRFRSITSEVQGFAFAVYSDHLALRMNLKYAGAITLGASTAWASLNGLFASEALGNSNFPTVPTDARLVFITMYSYFGTATNTNELWMLGFAKEGNGGRRYRIADYYRPDDTNHDEPARYIGGLMRGFVLPRSDYYTFFRPGASTSHKLGARGRHSSNPGAFYVRFLIFYI